jgi:multiple sugar transport system permease protein
MKLKEILWGYMFITPLIVGKVVFFLFPAAVSFMIAFTDWDGLGSPEFAGLQNFIKLWQDESFVHSLKNTVNFVLIAIPLSICLSTLFAVLLNQKIRGRSIFRTIYFLPVVTMPIAVGIVWQWLYNSEYGLVNAILAWFHIKPIDWLLDPNLIILSIALVWVWQSIGNNMVILLAGLQDISSSYYEAAELDGCGLFNKFFNITLPLLTPSLFFVVVISLLQSFQVFDLTYIMVKSSVDSSLLDSARTIVYSIYENGFKFFSMGYASAQAWVLFFILFVITLFQMYVQKKWVHYQ